VALSGEGADELFGGIPDATRQLLAGHRSALASPVLRALLAMAQAWPAIERQDRIRSISLKAVPGRLPACRPRALMCIGSGTFDDRERRSLVQQNCHRRSIPY